MAWAAVVGELERSQELLRKLESVLTSGGTAAAGLALVDEATTKVTGAIASLRGDVKANKCRKDCAVEEKGGIKRRRSTAGKMIMSDSLNDGYTWRKYGQKEIQNTKNPRCYFRCTYKHDRGCQATRQAQMSEDNPSIYQITYFGQHTCMEPFMSNESSNNNNLFSRQAPCMIDFGSPKQAQDQYLSLKPHPSTALLKQEQDHMLGTSFSQECLSSEHVPEQTSTSLEASLGLTQTSDVVSEHGDVTSISHTPMSLEMDFMDDTFLTSMCNLWIP